MSAAAERTMAGPPREESVTHKSFAGPSLGKQASSPNGWHRSSTRKRQRMHNETQFRMHEKSITPNRDAAMRIESGPETPAGESILFRGPLSADSYSTPRRIRRPRRETPSSSSRRRKRTDYDVQGTLLHLVSREGSANSRPVVDSQSTRGANEKESVSTTSQASQRGAVVDTKANRKGDHQKQCGASDLSMTGEATTEAPSNEQTCPKRPEAVSKCVSREDRRRALRNNLTVVQRRRRKKILAKVNSTFSPSSTSPFRRCEQASTQATEIVPGASLMGTIDGMQRERGSQSCQRASQVVKRKRMLEFPTECPNPTVSCAVNKKSGKEEENKGSGASGKQTPGNVPSGTLTTVGTIAKGAVTRIEPSHSPLSPPRVRRSARDHQSRDFASTLKRAEPTTDDERVQTLEVAVSESEVEGGSICHRRKVGLLDRLGEAEPCSTDQKTHSQPSIEDPHPASSIGRLAGDVQASNSQLTRPVQSGPDSISGRDTELDEEVVDVEQMPGVQAEHSQGHSSHLIKHTHLGEESIPFAPKDGYTSSDPSSSETEERRQKNPENAPDAAIAVDEQRSVQDSCQPRAVNLSCDSSQGSKKDPQEFSKTTTSNFSVEDESGMSSESTCRKCQRSQEETKGAEILGAVSELGLFNCQTEMRVIGTLGEGSDGHVQEVVIRGRTVALKRAKLRKRNTPASAELKARLQVSRELHYLRKVRHLPYFVQCLGACDGVDHTCIAFELMDFRLSQYQRRTVGEANGFPMSVVKAVMKQVASGMAYLHNEVNIAHGDLAFRNILVKENLDSENSNTQRLLRAQPPITVPASGSRCSEMSEGSSTKTRHIKFSLTETSVPNFVVKISDFGRIVVLEDSSPEKSEGVVESATPPLCTENSENTPKATTRSDADCPTDKEKFDWYKNVDVGQFGREILYRLLVGEALPEKYMRKRVVNSVLVDYTAPDLPPRAEEKLGEYLALYKRCVTDGIRPSFDEILQFIDHPERVGEQNNKPLPMAVVFQTSRPAIRWNNGLGNGAAVSGTTAKINNYFGQNSSKFGKATPQNIRSLGKGEPKQGTPHTGFLESIRTRTRLPQLSPLPDVSATPRPSLVKKKSRGFAMLGEADAEDVDIQWHGKENNRNAHNSRQILVGARTGLQRANTPNAEESISELPGRGATNIPRKSQSLQSTVPVSQETVRQGRMVKSTESARRPSVDGVLQGIPTTNVVDAVKEKLKTRQIIDSEEVTDIRKEVEQLELYKAKLLSRLRMMERKHL